MQLNEYNINYNIAYIIHIEHVHACMNINYNSVRHTKYDMYIYQPDPAVMHQTWIGTYSMYMHA